MNLVNKVNNFEEDRVRGVIEDLVTVFEQTVSTDDERRLVLAIWTACTWFPEEFDFFPRLYIASAVRGSGKTTCLEVLNKVSYLPISASSTTEAAIFRILDKGFRTLLLDEVDNMNLDQKGGLVAILNTGHQRDGFVIRCGDSKQKFEPQQYRASGFVAFAGLSGSMMPTLLSRSIQLNLFPAKPNQSLVRVSKLDVGLIDSIKERLESLRQDQEFIASVRAFEPAELFHNRTQDNWEPLMKLAGLSGKDVSSKLFEASRMLEDEKSLDDEDVKIVLLSDIQKIFERQNIKKLTTSQLVNQLVCLDDSQWSCYNRGRPIDNHQLTKLLRSFGVKTERIKVGDRTTTGYRIEQFFRVWALYLTVEVSPK